MRVGKTGTRMSLVRRPENGLLRASTTLEWSAEENKAPSYRDETREVAPVGFARATEEEVLSTFRFVSFLPPFLPSCLDRASLGAESLFQRRNPVDRNNYSRSVSTYLVVDNLDSNLSSAQEMMTPPIGYLSFRASQVRDEFNAASEFVAGRSAITTTITTTTTITNGAG